MWSAAGAQLATATFTGETASGWQTVTFSSPVAVTAGTTYVVSYLAPQGRYAVTSSYFTADRTVGPLTAPAAGNGRYRYGGGFPTSTWNATNYFVDVVYEYGSLPTPLAVAAQSPGSGALGVAAGSTVSVSFNEPLVAGASLGLSAGGSAVAGSVALSTDKKTLTFTPAAALALSTQYTATATGLASVEGSSLADVSWSFTTVSASGCPCSLFSDQTPVTAAAADTASVELGVSFVPSQDGLVTGVRFYKGAGNGGTHTGTLWSAAGAQLATATFTGETASGWQTVTFSSPVAVTAGTTYVVSYLAPQGRYAVTSSYFTADRTVGPLTAPAAGNGRYRYGGGFPTSTWNATNYFVDVVYDQSVPPTPPPPAPAPTVTSTSPASGATGVAASTTVSGVLSAAPASQPTLAVSSAAGAVTGTTTWNATSRTVTFSPSAPLASGTAYTAVVAVGGTALGNGTWSFAVVAAPPAPVSMWTNTEIPSQTNYNAGRAIQVGERFSSSVAGQVTALRFYKSAQGTGTHSVRLWSPTGTLLVSSAWTGAASASGWQTVQLPTPVTLTAGAQYTVTYYTSNGRLGRTLLELQSARVRGPLTIPAGGGVTIFGTGYPTTATTAGHGVDLVFQPAG